MFLAAIFSLLISFLPGQFVPEEFVVSRGVDSFFSSSEIPQEIFDVMKGKSYKDGCVIPRESLRYLLCLHKDADGRTYVGEMVVAESIAGKVLHILKELYKASYPIEKMRLVDYYDADDQKSMSANNSSAFNFRYISHSTKVSVHGLGLAVDINPKYNPYHKILRDGRELVEPEGAEPYLDRNASFPYMVKESDLCCRLFKEHGFEWGGDWKSCKDYQHFEIKL